MPSTLHRTSTPQLVKASGTAADPYILENMDIDVRTLSNAGLTLLNAQHILVRNVRIHHAPHAVGIQLINSHHARFENVEVLACRELSRCTPRVHGPGFENAFNIHCERSAFASFTNVRLSGGSSGIELTDCHHAHIRGADIRDMRGPFPRGQCVQFSRSPHGVLEDFVCTNLEDSSWTEDNLSAWYSPNVTIRRGLIDGNNSPTGVAVMYEHESSGLTQDVDAIHQGDGCFSGYDVKRGERLRYERVGCLSNHCEGWAGRGVPTSDSLVFAAGGGDGYAMGIEVVDSRVWDLCNPEHIFWSHADGGFKLRDARKEQFVPRAPVRVSLPWDEEPPAPAPPPPQPSFPPATPAGEPTKPPPPPSPPQSLSISIPRFEPVTSPVAKADERGEVPAAIVVGMLLAAVLLGAGCAVAFIKKGRRAATTEQEGLALQSPTPAARARPPGKARKTASKKGARRLVDDAAAEDADGWTKETVELD